MPGGRLTQHERQQIAAGLADDLAYAEIARRIDRPTSTITREVMRNGGPAAYRADLAHRATERRARRRGQATPRGSAVPSQPHGRDAQAVADYEETFTTVLMASGVPKMMSRVLTCLYTTDAGSLTAAELAGRLQVSPASISKAITALESQDLVRRERDERRRDRYIVDDDVWYQYSGRSEYPASSARVSAAPTMPRMASAADPAQPPPLHLRAGRVMGAGLTGAVVGGAVAGIWQAGLDAGANLCRDTAGTCLPLVQHTGAMFGNTLVIAVGVFAGFGLLRIRPLRLTVPLGCTLAIMLTWATDPGIPTAMAPAPWAAATAVGAGLAALALSADWGRAQLAGMITLAVIIIVAFALPRVISPLTRVNPREQALAALGFPLLVPEVPGYHPTGADAVGGGLSIYMSPDSGGNSRQIAFTVSIARVTIGGANTKPAQCAYATWRGCQAPPAGVWFTPGSQEDSVITWRGDLKVVAFSRTYMRVPTRALVHGHSG